MSPESGITDRVLDSLATAGLLTAEQVASVREAAATRGVSPGVVLTERDLVGSLDVVSVLEHDMGVPQVDLSSYAPEDDALALVPAAVAHGRRVLPLFEIEGMLTVAIGDPMDVFILDTVAAEIGLEVEPVLADAVSFAAALGQYYADDGSVPADVPVPEAQAGDATPVVEVADFFEEPTDATPAVPVAPVAEMAAAAAEAESPAAPTIEEVVAAEPQTAGPAAIDLDVLAVADARKVAVLVQDILEHAVSRGASRIHLLPYKDDFFLVYRVQGTLEKVASAPLSLQSSLVDGFKQYAKLGGVPPSRPALGRQRSHIADRDLVLTTSVVPTISGQRLVISLAAFRPQPRGLEELGVSEAEARALHAMVERGRGILLICAPVAGGSSTTYYALLAHAASTGKTVYSVEQSIEHEIPAVAQVMTEPGGPSPAAYIAAGMRQDTDVIAIDGLRTVEDVHLAVEAAGLGKLVLATVPAADISSGVRRMLELGAEPHSLAAALTVGVGQRLVRLNCPNCSVETDGRLAVRIPGAPGDIADRAGTGCPNCGKTGFRGATAIYEVLPFTEPVRAAVGRGATEDEIAQSAAAAGMRPLMVSGLARVKSGEVSAEELNRVLRYAD
ncbi:MAG TPA: ATPase, T2SS/T4P/T4SS family [Coriobacteriia bacterium]|nr:ATPase, T2SS/T4P/T4SS family [Coriobacteriia bacterium]